MKPFPLTLAALVLASCGTVRPITATDSTRVEVRTVTEYVKDTVYMELPVIVEKVATLDTASVLENKYAKSEASVSGGVLHHSLETKPVKEPVIVENRIVYRDSIVYRDRVQVQTVEVEKELTAWQRLKMRTGGITLILIVVATLYLIFFKSNLLKPKFL